MLSGKLFRKRNFTKFWRRSRKSQMKRCRRSQKSTAHRINTAILPEVRQWIYELDNWLLKSGGQISTEKPGPKDRLKKTLSDFIKKISGEAVSLDIKTMKGLRQGCHRIRKGDIKIIFSVRPLHSYKTSPEKGALNIFVITGVPVWVVLS